MRYPIVEVKFTQVWSSWWDFQNLKDKSPRKKNGLIQVENSENEK